MKDKPGAVLDGHNYSVDYPAVGIAVAVTGPGRLCSGLVPLVGGTIWGASATFSGRLLPLTPT